MAVKLNDVQLNLYLPIVIETLTAQPGASAYRVSLKLPLPEPEIGQLAKHHFPMVVVLALLDELQKTGRARVDPDPAGAHWYLIERETPRDYNPDDDPPPF